MVTDKPKKDFAILPKIINGGIAGITGVTCVFPLDLVKTRLQSQKVGPDGTKMYKNMFDCFRQTYKAEGFFGMYRGSGVNILLITPEKAIKLAANDFFRYHLTAADGTLSTLSQMLAGGLAGAFQIIVTTPMELLKIQMQDAGRVAAQAKQEGQQIEKISATMLAKQMVRERGIFGLYRGIGATAVRDISFSVIYFPLFAHLNSKGPKRDDGSGESVFWASFLAGLGSGSFSSLAVTPLDCIKTRLQAKGDVEYNGLVDVISKTLRDEGPTAFFKGGLCRMIVIAPLFGIAQMVYYLGVAEALLNLFN